MQPDPLFSLPWWRSIHHRWQKKRYAGTEFAPLFDTPPDNEWVSLDCETTGLNVKSDHLLSIGAVRIAGQRILSRPPGPPRRFQPGRITADTGSVCTAAS